MSPSSPAPRAAGSPGCLARPTRPGSPGPRRYDGVAKTVQGGRGVRSRWLASRVSGGVIGVDPGLASTGYAVVVGSGTRLEVIALGTIRTSSRTPHPERLRTIHDGVAALAADHGVRAAAVESWFVHPVSRAAMGMAEARGAILVALARAAIDVTEYAPNSIKQAVTGQGGADKAQVRAMVRRLAGADPEGDHEADALAAAICHLSSAPLRGAIRRAR